MKVCAIVPIKKDSERVIGKNKRLFCGKPLFHHILKTLQSCEVVEKIIINTDDEEIRDCAKKLFEKCYTVSRPDFLKGHDVIMDSLIKNDIQYYSGEHFLQTHCTNPLITEATITNAVEYYFENLETYDSLLAVNKIQCRLYKDDGSPLNHLLNIMERTQDMKPIWKESSSFFIFSKKAFLQNLSRVGRNPAIFEINEIESIDIDYENDFTLAEIVYENKNRFPDIFNL